MVDLSDTVNVDLYKQPPSRKFGPRDLYSERVAALEVGQGFYIQQRFGKPSYQSIHRMTFDWRKRQLPYRDIRCELQGDRILVFRDKDENVAHLCKVD